MAIIAVALMMLYLRDLLHIAKQQLTRPARKSSQALINLSRQNMKEGENVLRKHEKRVSMTQQRIKLNNIIDALLSLCSQAATSAPAKNIFIHMCNSMHDISVWAANTDSHIDEKDA